jgi:hypothetical protein
MPLFTTEIGAYLSSGASPFDRAQYAVARDGRFLMNTVIEAATTPPITVVVNWRDGTPSRNATGQ